ncbi:hypothetical protein Q4519_10000 [Motilimonas sp. 1_MG-2023]|uniref:hypothetical protein n=1 Tax=Motilimonas sp. 1_MG-2023 TaxID=3062672 RepID=UPI0026E2D4A8|nr:hypothetical protein [Motilimonas sp. 1_MG-2023]MDO6526012.1 hypothetical protein [Motilimonas sp. 1_MG-2023]
MDDKITKDPAFLDLLGQGQPLQAQKYLVDTYQLGVVDASLRVRAMQSISHTTLKGRFYRACLRIGQIMGLALFALSIYCFLHLGEVNKVTENIQAWPRVTADQWQRQGDQIVYLYQVASEEYQTEQARRPALNVATGLAEMAGQPLVLAYQADQPSVAYLYASNNLYTSTMLLLITGLLLLAMCQFFLWRHRCKHRRP